MAGRPPPPLSYFHHFPSLPTSTWAQITAAPRPGPASAAASLPADASVGAAPGAGAADAGGPMTAFSRARPSGIRPPPPPTPAPPPPPPQLASGCPWRRPLSLLLRLLCPQGRLLHWSWAGGTWLRPICLEGRLLHLHWQWACAARSWPRLLYPGRARAQAICSRQRPLGPVLPSLLRPRPRPAPPSLPPSS